jgi:hypothetical protein
MNKRFTIWAMVASAAPEEQVATTGGSTDSLHVTGGIAPKGRAQ